MAWSLEERLRAALEAGGTGTFRWDIRTDELWWDTALDRLFGLEPGRAVRSLEQFVALVHPDERAEVIERCRRCKEFGHDFDMEFRVVWPDGSVRWLYDRGRTLVGADGQPQAMTGACVDITQRRQAEQALREREAFYRRTLESVPGITFTTHEDGRVDYISEQWAAYTGRPVKEHLGSRWADALHPDDRSRAHAAWTEAWRERSSYSVEYRLRRHDGAYRWFKAQGCVIPATGDAPERWIGTIVDVHDLKLAQAAVQARERELRLVADNLPDVVSRFDRSLRHVFVSAAIEGLTGRPVSDFIGRTNRELGMPDDACDLWDGVIRRVFESGEPVGTHFFLEIQGAQRHFTARLVPERDETGAITHVLSVTRDTTDAWEAQEALRRADRQKDDFLATLAHELRNPLAPLRTGLTVLRRQASAGPEERRVRDIMERQLEHMVRLVDELLDVARISQGKVMLQREPVPASTVVQHALDASRPLLEAQGHALTVDPGSDEWLVHGDVTRLVQVVGNLLNNAAKYTPAGGRVALAVTATAHEVVIAVEDSGIGIPRDMLDRIFDRFVQGEAGHDRAQGGLGIGLSVVRSLVEMHGGQVGASSGGPGLGSRFEVRLPRVHAERASAAVSPAPAAAGPDPLRILVVDDNVDAAETLAMALELEGHSVRLAHEGSAAIEVAEQHRPHVVFLDIGMPGMDGYAIAARLRELPDWEDRVLVALTGWGAEEDRRRSLAAGFDMHLTKPVDFAAVERLLTDLATARSLAAAVSRPRPLA
ncbi:PAS domain-containing protein [Ramlibacter sp. MMS24-I3-19]|uniref:PAS domain-containing hybrid sensor histidine kinase/response regulator n=1 Tax=Ramlibacter sp. MMS24-I3-19 TaxID=3416606 RepID=UPI003D038E8E